MPRTVILPLLFFVIYGCQSGDSPVPINRGVDMCEFCRMTIDDFHYSAEITEKRKVYKFDDIGCMMAYAQTNNLDSEKVRFWVMDFEDATWIKGEDAYFALSPQIHTPMGYGIIAFRDPTKAKTTAEINGGTVTLLESLFNMDWKPRHEH